MGAVVEQLVPRVVGRRLPQRKVAALGAGLPGIGPGAVGEPRVSSPGGALGEVGGRNGRAGSPLQGLLLSLGVEGHVATAMASGREEPEEQGRRESGSVWSK